LTPKTTKIAVLGVSGVSIVEKEFGNTIAYELNSLLGGTTEFGNGSTNPNGRNNRITMDCPRVNKMGRKPEAQTP
jgi:hypothetical protein